jgi:hypothetical protein
MHKCAGSGATENRSMAECFQNRMERSQSAVSELALRPTGILCPTPVRIIESCELSDSSKGK